MAGGCSKWKKLKFRADGGFQDKWKLDFFVPLKT
jgi:hypothetical protein